MDLRQTQLTLPALDPAPRTVLVLGGGGMKGIAHIGAWKALEESGIRPDLIVGTSIGSLIGACLAGGLGWRELAEIARGLSKDDIVEVNRRALWLGGVRESALFVGDRFRSYLERTIPVRRFDELQIPLYVNATSLVTGTEIWFGTGMEERIDLVESVYASCALPIYFPPSRANGDVLVDGGVLDAFPIRRAGAIPGVERVIGVDVGSELVPPHEGHFDQGMIAIHDRVLGMILHGRRRTSLAEYDGPPLLYIRPEIGHLHTFDFDRTQFFMEEGYVAAREALGRYAAA